MPVPQAGALGEAEVAAPSKVTARAVATRVAWKERRKMQCDGTADRRHHGAATRTRAATTRTLERGRGRCSTRWARAASPSSTTDRHVVGFISDGDIMKAVAAQKTRSIFGGGLRQHGAVRQRVLRGEGAARSSTATSWSWPCRRCCAPRPTSPSARSPSVLGEEEVQEGAGHRRGRQAHRRGAARHHHAATCSASCLATTRTRPSIRAPTSPAPHDLLVLIEAGHRQGCELL